MAFLGAGLLNGVWVIWQLITSNFHPFFSIWWKMTGLDFYGPTLIGETSPLATGGLFLLAALLTFNFYLFMDGEKMKWLYGTLFVVCSTAIALSFSRVSMGAAVVGILYLLIQGKQTEIRKSAPLLIISLFVASLAMYYVGFLSASDRLAPSGIDRGFSVRLVDIWLPLFLRGLQRFFLGFGKGALGSILGLEATEAHNHYLRVFLESGIFGLITFILMLRRILTISFEVFNKSKTAICKIIGGTSLISTIGLCFAALLQDVFYPVLPTILWWMLVGLATAAYRLEINKINEVSSKNDRLKSA